MRRAGSIVALLLLACPSEDPGTGMPTDLSTSSGEDTHEEHGTEGHASTTTTTDATTGSEASSGGTASAEAGSGSGDASSGTAASTTDAAEDTWENWALPSFFAVYCNQCHPAAGQSARDFSDYDTVGENFEHIRCGVAPKAIEGCDAGHIRPGHLPIGPGPYPSDEERWRLVDWMDAGMPRD